MRNSFRPLYDHRSKKLIPSVTSLCSLDSMDSPITVERSLIKSFWLNPEEKVNELITFIDRSPAYTTSHLKDWSGRTSVSCSGLITVCLDIFGPEVKIHPSTHLLDCHPSTYGLSQASANQLYESILTRVPGTSTFKFTPIEL